MEKVGDGTSGAESMIQWHPGFVAAMNLEFDENRNDLLFEDEYNLNKRPLEIDLLVIKKKTGVKIKNEIGVFFRKHNLMEFKSPEDSLNIDTLYKVIAYAALYKSYGDTVDAVPADDITVTLVRERKPEELFAYLERHGTKISRPFGGIYYLEEGYLFPVQIVVYRELDAGSHVWLKALSDHMQKQEMRDFLERVSKIKEQGKREFADSVLEVSAKANMDLIELLRKEGDVMSDALMEIFAPEINQIVNDKVEKRVREITENKQIARLILTARKHGISEKAIIEDISVEFHYSEEDAKGKIEEYDAGRIQV